MNDHLHLIQDLIANRRTIKPAQYTGEPVEDAFVELILEAANWAPTHGYTEPWRFTVFKDEALEGLGRFLAELDQPDSKAEDFNLQRFERLRKRPAQASHIIAIGMVSGKNPKIPEIEEICATAMAVQNMWLTAHAMGLGAYWSTGHLAFKDETRAYLGFPDGAKSLGFFYLGKKAVDNPQGRRLSPIQDKVAWRTKN